MKTTTPITAAALVALYSPSKLLKHAVEHSQSIHVGRDGTFAAWYDDYANDVRLFATYRGGHTFYAVTTLRGYDAEKHCWTRETGEVRVEITNRRGQAACKAIHLQLAKDAGHVHPGSRTVHLYRNEDGVWFSVKPHLTTLPTSTTILVSGATTLRQPSHPTKDATMDINANWTEIAAILDAGNATGDDERERLTDLIEAGMQWFAKGGFTPNALAMSRDNCTRIYAALNDRYCVD